MVNEFFGLRRKQLNDDQICALAETVAAQLAKFIINDQYGRLVSSLEEHKLPKHTGSNFATAKQLKRDTTQHKRGRNDRSG